MDITTLLMAIGFLLAGYSIIANDAMQTLGTFIGSNRSKPWYILWLYTSSILLFVLTYGWIMYSGDVSYNRLEKFPVPENFNIVYIIPPLVVLLLTRFGIPVSTTFIVLTVFAPTALTSMLSKSVLGYLIAFIVAFIVYRFITHSLEQHYHKTKEHKVRNYWYILQWGSTGLLWSQWLIQDLANIFVYMPSRTLDLQQLIIGSITLISMLALVFYMKGGAIQHIVSSKTNTADIRVATIIDFIYAVILFVFKEYSTIPMSTTWVFIGLLAGREYAMSFIFEHIELKKSLKLIMQDIGKATIGLLISILIALIIPQFL